jgi:6-phosphogluconate dehydrogenase
MRFEFNFEAGEFFFFFKLFYIRKQKINDYFKFYSEIDLNKYVIQLTDKQKEILKKNLEEEKNSLLEKGKNKNSSVSPGMSSSSSKLDPPPPPSSSNPISSYPSNLNSASHSSSQTQSVLDYICGFESNYLCLLILF